MLHFLDVGQGDATLIQTPENKLILVDGGPDGKVLISKLSQFFLDGQCRLEAIVLTHPDLDHEAGLLEALKRCEVKTVVANTANCEAFNCKQFNGLLDPRSSARGGLSGMTGAVVGDVFEIGAVTLTVLNPPSYQNFNDENTNDDSIVLLLTYGSYKALLTGDAENKTFDRLSSLSNLSLLKVPHHGSGNNFDAAVWEHLRPEGAGISVGKNNYGHPSDKVLGEATVLGTRVLRTDQVGDVTIQVNESGRYKIL